MLAKRISAYGHSKKDNNVFQTIDLFMIDLDLSNFKSNNNNMKALDLAKTKTLAKIHDTFGIEFNPSIIWSGNGYHFYIPAESKGVILEQMSEPFGIWQVLIFFVSL